MITTLTHWLRPTSRARRASRFFTTIEQLEGRVVPDATYFQLANDPGGIFQQDWSTANFTKNNDWSAIPSIQGFTGNNLATSAGKDPETITTFGPTTPTPILINQSGDPGALTPGGIAQFIPPSPTISGDSTVALAGDAGPNQAPFLLLYLNTTGTGHVQVSYTLRDIDNTHNANSSVALQFRVSNNANFTDSNGNPILFTNVPGAFVPDASLGSGTATPVAVTLPSTADNMPFVQVRIITDNATDVGTGDEWIGVDNIVVHGNKPPVLNLNLPSAPDNVLTYTENDPLTPIAPDAVITDPDSPDFASSPTDVGQLSIQFVNTATANDRIIIPNQGITAGEISLSNGMTIGSTVSYTDTSFPFPTTVIGKITSDGVATDPLTVQFTSTAATQAAVQALLQSIGYFNPSDDPIPGTPSSPPPINNTFTISLSDGDGEISAPVTRPLSVIAVDDPPAVTLPDGPLNVSEQDPAKALAPHGTVVDPDSHNFDTGTLTVSFPNVDGTANDFLTVHDETTDTPAGHIGVSGSNITYDGVVFATFTGGTQGTNLVITFNNQATASTDPPNKVQALLDDIYFQNTSNDPPLATRAVRYVLTDGDGGSSSSLAVSQVAVTIQPINNPPSLSLSLNGISYTENDAPANVDSGVAITDPDSPDFSGGTLTLTISSGDVFDRLSIASQGTGPGTIDLTGTTVTFDPGTGSGPVIIGSVTSGGTGKAPLQITFTPNASQAAVQALARAITYANTSDNPGFDLSVSALSNLGVTSVERAFTSNDVGSSISIQAAPGWTQGTYTIVSVANGVATLNASPAAAGTSGGAGTIVRKVTWVVTDGDGGSSATPPAPPQISSITIIPVNDPPSIGNLDGTSATYSAGLPATIVAPSGTVTDPDSLNFAGGNLTIAIDPTPVAGDNPLPADTLGIRNLGVGAGRIGISGSNVTFGPSGVVIGTFAGGTDLAPLVVTLNANATPAAVQALLQSITFKTANGAGVVGPRTLVFTASDGNAVNPLSAPADMTVTVTSTAGPNDDFYETSEDVPLVISAANGVLANDPNPAQDVVDLASPNFVPPTLGSLTLNADGSFNYVPNSNANGTDTFTYAWKNATTNATGTALVTITIDPVNDPPTVLPNPLPTVTVNEDAGLQSIANFATIGPGGGPDEASQTLTTTVANDNNALFIAQPAIDANGRLTFTSAPNANGSATVTYTVQDSGGTFDNPLDQDTTVVTFQIVVVPVNDQPTIQVQAAPPTVLEDAGPQVVTGPNGTPFVTFQPGPLTAVDEQSQTPTYLFTQIGNVAPQSPTGKLEFSAGPSIDANGNLTYTTAPNSNGTASFILQANDGGGTANGGVDLSSPRTFVITVTPVNDPPTVNPVSTGVLWNSAANVIPVLALGNDSGAPDVGEKVAVIAVSQPANGTVAIQPGGTTVTYQPRPTFVGTDTFTYTVSDGDGATATNTVSIDVHRSDTQAVNIVAVGSGIGGNAEVRIYDSKTGEFMNGFAAFDPSFEGGISVATGDVNGDGVPDIIVGAGAGGGPRIEIIDGTKLGLLQGPNQIANPSALLANMFVYDWNFHGGVTVASGDVNGDGKADIIVGTGPGGGPNVKVINGAMLNDLGPDGLPAPAAVITSFFAYDPNFRGGVNVASADVNGDGFADVLTAPGAGGGSQIKVYNGHTLIQSGADAPNILIASFYAFDPNFLGGVNIAAGDLNGDGLADIILGAGPGGGPNVKVFSPDNIATPIASFFAFDPSFSNGVFVGYRERDGGASPLLLAGSGAGDSASLIAFAPPNFTPVQNIDAFDSDFTGGVSVG